MKAQADRLFVLAVLSACVFGPTLADDPPVTAVQLARPVSEGMSVFTNTENGVMTSTVLTGDPVMFRRSVADTLEWSTATTVDATSIYLEVGAMEQTQGGLKTCCKFTCDNGAFHHFDFQRQDCPFGGYGCQVCDLTCTPGWINCPAGTKLVPVVE